MVIMFEPQTHYLAGSWKNAESAVQGWKMWRMLVGAEMTSKSSPCFVSKDSWKRTNYATETIRYIFVSISKEQWLIHLHCSIVKGKKWNKTRVDKLSWPKKSNRYCSTGLRVFWWLKFEQELVNVEDRLQKG